MTKDSQPFDLIEIAGDRAATKALGARIAAGLERGDCVLLEGDLGAGKTTLARGILQALGVQEHVASPTFTMVWSYETPKILVSHYDLYRVQDSSEIDELGIDDALEAGAALIEWPGRAGNRLPPDALHVAIEIRSEGMRLMTIHGSGKWRQVLLADHDVA
jgi:tRNA threonylcarbamoyl adenosine modification protein YjeE